MYVWNLFTCTDDRHVGPQLSRHAKVGDLAAVLGVEQDVGALDITVDQALAVQEFQSPRCVRQDGDSELPPDL